MEQINIEIKKVQAKEIAVSTKKTVYVCICWYNNGVFYANSPTEDKRTQEQYAFSMGKHGNVSIYSFEIDIPVNKQHSV